MNATTTAISLGYLTEAAMKKVVKVLEGQTYMNFRVNRGRCPGGYKVEVATDYDADYGEIAGMAMHVMAEDM